MVSRKRGAEPSAAWRGSRIVSQSGTVVRSRSADRFLSTCTWRAVIFRSRCGFASACPTPLGCRFESGLTLRFCNTIDRQPDPSSRLSIRKLCSPSDLSIGMLSLAPRRGRLGVCDSLAHPDFRERLLAEAKQQSLAQPDNFHAAPVELRLDLRHVSQLGRAHRREVFRMRE